MHSLDDIASVVEWTSAQAQDPGYADCTLAQLAGADRLLPVMMAVACVYDLYVPPDVWLLIAELLLPF